MALRLWNTLENRLVEVEPVKAGEIPHVQLRTDRLQRSPHR